MGNHNGSQQKRDRELEVLQYEIHFEFRVLRARALILIISSIRILSSPTLTNEGGGCGDTTRWRVFSQLFRARRVVPQLFSKFSQTFPSVAYTSWKQGQKVFRNSFFYE